MYETVVSPTLLGIPSRLLYSRLPPRSHISLTSCTHSTGHRYPIYTYVLFTLVCKLYIHIHTIHHQVMHHHQAVHQSLSVHSWRRNALQNEQIHSQQSV